MPAHLDPTQHLAQLLAPLTPWFALAALVLALTGLVLAVVAAAGRRSRPRDGEGSGQRAPESNRLGYETDLASLQSRVRALEAEVAELRAELRRSLRRLGVVRYNAFEDVGADLSFSLALMSDEGDGVVLTGLYGREETRVYSKPLSRGTSAYPLSAEEQKAIALARGESS